MFIEDSDMSQDEYTCYHPASPIKIFNYVVEEDDLEEISIYVHKNMRFSMKELSRYISEYLDWFQNCREVLTEYYSTELNDALPDDWFETLEVYFADITFNSREDFGAEISCGDNVISDHIIEFQFDKYSVADSSLNG